MHRSNYQSQPDLQDPPNMGLFKEVPYAVKTTLVGQTSDPGICYLPCHRGSYCTGHKCPPYNPHLPSMATVHLPPTVPGESIWGYGVVPARLNGRSHSSRLPSISGFCWRQFAPLYIADLPATIGCRFYKELRSGFIRNRLT